MSINTDPFFLTKEVFAAVGPLAVNVAVLGLVVVGGVAVVRGAIGSLFNSK